MTTKNPFQIITDDNNSGGDVSKEVHILREQLQQQSQHTKQALAQLMLLREQLITETNARIEAQVRHRRRDMMKSCIWIMIVYTQFSFFSLSLTQWRNYIGENSTAHAAKSWALGPYCIDEWIEWSGKIKIIVGQHRTCTSSELTFDYYLSLRTQQFADDCLTAFYLSVFLDVCSIFYFILNINNNNWRMSNSKMTIELRVCLNACRWERKMSIFFSKNSLCCFSTCSLAICVS